MNEKLEAIIKECAKRGIHIEVERESERMVYIVHGFSKSGTAVLYHDPDSQNVCCDTRYKQRDIIEDFDDYFNVWDVKNPGK